MQTEKVIDYIVDWLKTYAKDAGVKGFVAGISGGVDSAVVSTLCAKTGLPTLCVELPIHQPENQVNRAEEHISKLKKKFDNVTNIAIDLSSVFEQFKTSVPHVADNKNLNLTLANTRARLRMTTLYYFAGLHEFLVAGTGNKVEDFGVGFFTKYGDGGVDISPLADLMKSDVYEIAKSLGISESILQAAPTDGLFDDSPSDEEQIGATYDELEWAMEHTDEPEENLSERQKEVMRIYKDRNAANQHKMKPIPVCGIPIHLKK